jgi:excinuclease UvrABC nuclease subunit
MGPSLRAPRLRRCVEELDPHPSHPGCVYSEMKMCLAPCYQGCTDARYAEESAAVERFLATRGESRLVALRTQREAASRRLEFETAAALHTQVQKVEAVRALTTELVRPMSQLRAVILQPSASPDEVTAFLFEDGQLLGPVSYSILGMRIQNEQSGSSSLFAQPMAIEAVPDEAGNRDQGSGVREAGNREQGTGVSPGPTAEVPSSATAGAPLQVKIPRTMLEARLESALEAATASKQSPNATQRQGHLALLKRWYYRPEVKRVGEIFFPDDEGHWPLKAILRGIGRVAAKSLAPVRAQ